MVFGEFRQVVRRCRLRSFEAVGLARSLRELPEDNRRPLVFNDLIELVTDAGRSSGEAAVDTFCDEWERLRNNESIAWIIRAAIAMPDKPFAKFILDETFRVLTSAKVRQPDRNEMFEIITLHCRCDTSFGALVRQAIASFHSNPAIISPSAARVLDDYLLQIIEYLPNSESFDDKPLQAEMLRNEQAQRSLPLAVAEFFENPVPLSSLSNSSDDEQLGGTGIEIYKTEKFEKRDDGETPFEDLVQEKEVIFPEVDEHEVSFFHAEGNQQGNSQLGSLPNVLTVYFRATDLFVIFENDQMWNQRDKTEYALATNSTGPIFSETSCPWLTSNALSKKKNKIVVAIVYLGSSIFLIVCQDGTLMVCREEIRSDDETHVVAKKLPKSKRHLKFQKARDVPFVSLRFVNEEMPLLCGAVFDKITGCLFVNAGRRGVFTCPIDETILQPCRQNKTIFLKPFISDVDYSSIALAQLAYPAYWFAFCCQPSVTTVDCYSIGVANCRGTLTQLSIMNNSDFYLEICATHCETGVPNNWLLMAISGYRKSASHQVEIYAVKLGESDQDWRRLCSLDSLEKHAQLEKYPRLIAFDHVGNLYTAVRGENGQDTLLGFSWMRNAQSPGSTPMKRALPSTSPLNAIKNGDENALDGWYLTESWRVAIGGLITSLTVTTGDQAKIIVASISQRAKGRDISCYKLLPKSPAAFIA